MSINNGHFKIYPSRELDQEKLSEYLITSDDCVQKFGNLSIRLPVYSYKTPCESYLPGSVFVTFKASCIAHSIIVHRLDTTDEFILYKAWEKSNCDGMNVDAARSDYLRKLLPVLFEETESHRDYHECDNGSFHYLKSLKTCQSIDTCRYQGVFMEGNDWDGTVLFLEHYVEAPQNFNFCIIEAKQPKHLSLNMHSILLNIKTIEF